MYCMSWCETNKSTSCFCRYFFSNLISNYYNTRTTITSDYCWGGSIIFRSSTASTCVLLTTNTI